MKHGRFLLNSISLILAITVLFGVAILPVSAGSGPSPLARYPECTCVGVVKNYLGITDAVGDAWQVGSYLVSHGFVETSDPQRGDVMVMQNTFPGANSTFGHVGIVENISSSGNNWDMDLLQNYSGGSYNTGKHEAYNCDNTTIQSWSNFSKSRTDFKFYTKSIPPLPCYILTSSHTGNGGDPAASPANSASCPIGQYIQGESISLTASPSNGWGVASWTGTGNDASTSITNTITMPGSAHQVAVAYRDIIPPTVVSSVRANLNPTNAASVNYTVTFSEAVTDVDGADFSLSTTGTISGASVGTVAGSGSTYTVPVNTGIGSGDLRLDVSVGATVTDSAGGSLANRPFTTGESYTFDKTPPTVVSIMRAGVSPTNATVVDFTVTFNEPVKDVDCNDFDSCAGVSGGPAIYTVSVNTGSIVGDGELSLNVPASAAVSDMVGNALTYLPYTGSESYTIDKTVPTVVSSVRLDPNHTRADIVHYSVTFSEPVTGVDINDFYARTSHSIRDAQVVDISTLDNTTYTITVNTGIDDDIVIALACSMNYPILCKNLVLEVPETASVHDLAGNSLSGLPFTSGESYTIDKTPPMVAWNVRVDPNPARAASLNFNVFFSEPVTGVGVEDFSLSTTGTLSGGSVAGVSGGPIIYTVSVNTGSGDGDLRLDMPVNATVSDMVGNALPTPFTSGESYKVDRTPPTVVSIVNADPNPTSASSVNYTVTFSEAVAGVDSADFALSTTDTLSGVSVTGISGGPVIYTVSANTGTGDGTLRLDVPASATVTDMAENQLTASYTGTEIYTVDRKGPTVISVVPARANGDFVVTFSEPVQSVEANDFALVKTGDIKDESITNVVCQDNICLVGINTGRGSGTLRLEVPVSATITDLAGGALTKLPYTTGKRYTIMIEAFRSTGSGDGWLLESAAGSGKGGSANSTATSFTLGDDALNRQYRTLLHFPTAYLPDNAVVIQADLMIKKQDEYGATFDTFGNLTVDIRNGLFVSYHDGGFGSLVPANFEARADAASVGGSTWNHNVTGWYWTTLSRDANPFISLNAGTQIRLGYQTATNMNGLAEYVRFYSGDHESQKDRPHLQIRYCVPG
jgi:hypothetical protein